VFPAAVGGGGANTDPPRWARCLAAWKDGGRGREWNGGEAIEGTREGAGGDPTPEQTGGSGPVLTVGSAVPLAMVFRLLPPFPSPRRRATAGADPGNQALASGRTTPAAWADLARWAGSTLAGLALLISLLLPAPPALAAMDYAKQVLIGADFHGADLRGVTFNLTNLRDADFHGADLRGASLFGAKLQDANLQDVDLREATLDSAVFQGTDLRHARLDDAFAFNTRFEGVLIDGADFTNVPLRADARKRLCATAQGTNPSSGRATRDTLGCP
jgi:hypothetical protein